MTSIMTLLAPNFCIRLKSKHIDTFSQTQKYTHVCTEKLKESCLGLLLSSFDYVGFHLIISLKNPDIKYFPIIRAIIQLDIKNLRIQKQHYPVPVTLSPPQTTSFNTRCLKQLITPYDIQA